MSTVSPLPTNTIYGGVRHFIVLVQRPGKAPLGYPQAPGCKALETMETLEARGRVVRAYTSANGVQELLSLAELRAALL